jgi:hypothetical protein
MMMMMMMMMIMNDGPSLESLLYRSSVADAATLGSDRKSTAPLRGSSFLEAGIARAADVQIFKYCRCMSNPDAGRTARQDRVHNSTY